MSEITADKLGECRDLLKRYMALIISEESVSYLDLIRSTDAVPFSKDEIAMLKEIEEEARSDLNLRD